MKNFVLCQPGVPVEASQPHPERVMSGAPEFRTENFYGDAASGRYCGTWHVKAGAWAVSYTEWEYCHIVAGSAVIVDVDGDRRRVSAGDSFVIEPGFAGHWDVADFVTKLYVIVEPAI